MGEDADSGHPNLKRLLRGLDDKAHSDIDRKALAIWSGLSLTQKEKVNLLMKRIIQNRAESRLS